MTYYETCDAAEFARGASLKAILDGWTARCMAEHVKRATNDPRSLREIAEIIMDEYNIPTIEATNG